MIIKKKIGGLRVKWNPPAETVERIKCLRWLGLSYREIAKEAGKSPTAIHKLLNKKGFFSKLLDLFR